MVQGASSVTNVRRHLLRVLSSVKHAVISGAPGVRRMGYLPLRLKEVDHVGASCNPYEFACDASATSVRKPSKSWKRHAPNAATRSAIIVLETQPLRRSLQRIQRRCVVRRRNCRVSKSRRRPQRHNTTHHMSQPVSHIVTNYDDLISERASRTFLLMTVNLF